MRICTDDPSIGRKAFLDHVQLDARLKLLIDKVEKTSRTDFEFLDLAAESVMRAEIAKHKAGGTRTTVRQLLSVTGVGTTFRHNRPKMPLSSALLEEFRRSDQSAQQLGGNAHWHARTPSGWGLPSARVLRQQTNASSTSSTRGGDTLHCTCATTPLHHTLRYKRRVCAKEGG